MKNVSEQLISDLIKQGVDTFFGIQGGACARLVEDVIKFNGKFIPVLNEQSAGYYAHGYFMATKKTAGLIFTTGPGLTNGVSGIAACYYDRVPLVTLVGQVPTRLNISKKTRTRMVGFQELPHLEICKPISDFTFKVDNIKSFKDNRSKILSNLNSKVQIIEVLDDVQRMKINNVKNYKRKKIINKNFSLNRGLQKIIETSKDPIILLGAGFSRSKNERQLLKKLRKKNIRFACTWGAQNIQKYVTPSDNYLGIFGNHNPGFANNKIKKSDLIISLGCSLLQHQVGKNYNDFAPLAKVIFVNDDLNECKRAKKQFGRRLNIVNIKASSFLFGLKKFKFKPKKLTRNESPINAYPVKILQRLMEKVNKDSLFFSDAGATLSWTYQAANNLIKCPQIFTSFNLHSMGYANCAAIGAAIKRKNIFCIIGDGSVPMNSQEMFWLKKFPVKMIIIDNKGYGIIRQTQRLFYKSKFIGSDFKNRKSSLPKFNVKNIIDVFKVPTKIVNLKNFNKDLNWFLKQKKSCVLIANIDYNLEVKT